MDAWVGQASWEADLCVGLWLELWGGSGLLGGWLLIVLVANSVLARRCTPGLVGVVEGRSLEAFVVVAERSGAWDRNCGSRLTLVLSRVLVR